MTSLNSQNYIALDLEMNQNPETKVAKIIQVGIAIGNVNSGILTTFDWYVNPEEPLVPYITTLTGITQEDIATKSVSHQTVAQELGALIDTYKPFVDPITWGQGDVLELTSEFSQNSVPFPYFGRRIIDVKTMYGYTQLAVGKSPAGGLRKTMNRNGIPFVGTPHRASVDASNTLRFFFYLLERQQMLENLIQTAKIIR